MNFTISMNYVMILFHDYSDYIVNGQHCALKVSTMNKIKLFISWMSTRKKQNTFQLSSQYLPSLTYQDFNKFRQEDMSRMTKVPTTQTPSTTKPLLSLTSRSKTGLVFLSQLTEFHQPLQVKSHLEIPGIKVQLGHIQRT